MHILMRRTMGHPLSDEDERLYLGMWQKESGKLSDVVVFLFILYKNVGHEIVLGKITRNKSTPPSPTPLWVPLTRTRHDRT